MTGWAAGEAFPGKRLWSRGLRLRTNPVEKVGREAPPGPHPHPCES